MAAVLRRLTETDEHGVRRHYAACYARNVASANCFHADGFDVDGMFISHWVEEQPELGTDDERLARGWARYGVVWVCPQHASGAT